MRLHRSILIVAFAFTLTACSNESGRLLVAPVRPPTKLVPMSQPVNAVAAGDLGVRLYRQQLAFIVSETTKRRNSPPPYRGSLRAATPTPPESMVAAVSETASVDWDCIATAETGADWTMHGSRYSSGLGVMNEAVRENAPTDVAGGILNGTASRQEQIDMAQGIVNKHGIDAWASSTVAKCT